ncbi:MAG: SRPBCC family protein [Crocinitomicaceae bacterium]
MKKWIFRLLKLVGVLAAIYLIVAIFAPSSYRVERSRDIAASPEVIFEQISIFENWDAWSPWGEKDSTMTSVRTGEPGTVGSKTEWTGDPELSGTGSMTMTELVEFVKITYDLHFDDMDMTSQGGIDLKAGEESTTVTWYDGADIPFLFRPMVMFFDIEAKVGPDFERGLELLDSVAVAKQAELDAAIYEIRTIDFPETKYYSIHNEVPFSGVDSAFFASNYGQLGMFCGENQIEMSGMPVSICFEWNEETEMAVLMPAFPVADNSTPGKGMVLPYTIPACQALVVDYYGEYDENYDAHMQIDAYAKENGLEYSIVMEEFVTDPTTVESMDEVLTRIYYFLK